MKLPKLAIAALVFCTVPTVELMSQLLTWTHESNQAIAQDSSCFMITSQGRRINLDSLCGSSDRTENRSTPVGSQSSSNASRAKIDINGTIKIPIKRRLKNIPIVDVTFNGDRVYEMMFDTGASHTLITAEMARSLNATPYNSAEFSIADGSTVKFPVGEVKSIEISSLKIQVMPVAIAVKSDIGLLGNDFFGQFDIKIGRSEIELSPRKLF